jgi:hypothetical protein
MDTEQSVFSIFRLEPGTLAQPANSSEPLKAYLLHRGLMVLASNAFRLTLTLTLCFHSLRLRSHCIPFILQGRNPSDTTPFATCVQHVYYCKSPTNTQ